CVEAGGFPDQVNMDGLRDDVIVRPGTVYRQTTRYRVGVHA
ncbi:galactose-1-epimerase, partial [Burkholderia cenocepacia]|nr:galactose-1-epimerase [Burkholderia cenocepacia]